LPGIPEGTGPPSKERRNISSMSSSVAAGAKGDNRSRSGVTERIDLGPKGHYSKVCHSLLFLKDMSFCADADFGGCYEN
jgi:hypothetical protein